jgi:phosphocarrier protein
MVRETVHITHKNGIHLRPAGDLCKLALNYDSEVKLVKGDRTCNVKSVISLLSACAKNGDEVDIICEGHDEKEAMAAILEVLRDDEE